MAGIDKIYGTPEQYDEFRWWLQKHKSEYLRYLYPRPEENGGMGPISNFPGEADAWLLVNCPFRFVVDRIKEQYNA